MVFGINGRIIYLASVNSHQFRIHSELGFHGKLYKTLTIQQ